MPTDELASCCPVCASRQTHEVAGPDDVTREVEALWAFHTRRLRPDTPPEHLADRIAFSQHPPRRVVRCARCGLVFRHPREGEGELTARYAGEVRSCIVLESLLQTQRVAYRAQAERLTREVGRTGTGLEVGSYVGAFLAAARERGWRFEGVDINAGAATFARSRGFRVAVGDLRAVDAGRRFDAVAIWNCFDQLADPGQAAAAAREVLEPDGVLAVRVPNGAFYVAARRLMRSPPLACVARTLLAHNNLLTFPYRHGFTVRSLTRLLERAGFRVRRVVGDTLVPVADSWTRPWAAWEERAVKRAMRAVARAGAGPRIAPWIEVYARPRR